MALEMANTAIFTLVVSMPRLLARSSSSLIARMK